MNEEKEEGSPEYTLEKHESNYMEVVARHLRLDQMEAESEEEGGY